MLQQHGPQAWAQTGRRQGGHPGLTDLYAVGRLRLAENLTGLLSALTLFVFGKDFGKLLFALALRAGLGSQRS